MKEILSQETKKYYFESVFEQGMDRLPVCDPREAQRHQMILEKFMDQPFEEGRSVEKFAKVLVFKNAKQNKRYDMWMGNQGADSHVEILSEALPENGPEYENSLRNYGSGEIFVLSDGVRVLYYKHGRHQEEIADTQGNLDGIRDIMIRYRLQVLLCIRFEREGEKFFNVSYFRHGENVQRVESRRFTKEMQKKVEGDLWEARMREIARKNGLTDPREYRAFRLRAHAIFEGGVRVSGSDTLEEIVKEYVRKKK